MIEKIEDLGEPPVIGRNYDLPAVELSGVVFPVLAPSHTDEELGTPDRHFHIDIRFASDAVLGAACTSLAECTPPRTHHDRNSYIHPSVFFTGDPRIVRQSFECLRDVFEYRTNRRLEDGWDFDGYVGPSRETYEKLKDEMADGRLDSCMKCPHKGTPLSSQPIKDGVVTCPAHGLSWNVETGRLVRAQRGTPCPSNSTNSATPTASLATSTAARSRSTRWSTRLLNTIFRL